MLDDGAYHPVLTGCVLSRSKVLFFRHNDMADLERVLRSVHAGDKKGPDLSQTQRRFIVTEGLFANTGEVCPLPDLVRLRDQCVVTLASPVAIVVHPSQVPAVAGTNSA